jgi:hypothetical protein
MKKIDICHLLFNVVINSLDLRELEYQEDKICVG